MKEYEYECKACGCEVGRLDFSLVRTHDNAFSVYLCDRCHDEAKGDTMICDMCKQDGRPCFSTYARYEALFDADGNELEVGVSIGPKGSCDGASLCRTCYNDVLDEIKKLNEEN